MKISVFGIGHVGTVTAAMMARAGHDVVGVDINQTKIELVNAGKPPIYENGVESLIRKVVEEGKLKATFDARAAVSETELTFFCVGVPVDHEGNANLSVLKRVCAKAGQVLANKKSFHTFVVRTSLLPGTTEDVLIPILEVESGKKVFIDFDVCVNPHFLRIGSLIEDFEKAPFNLIGEQVSSAGDRVASLYGHLKMEQIRTHIRTAELAPFVLNSFHALKTAFANEIGIFAKSLSLDSHEMLKLLRMDSRVSLSSEYLESGPAYGGPEMPALVRRVLGSGKSSGIDLPVLSAIPQSSDVLLKTILRMIPESAGNRVGLVGLAFRPGSDEFRESLLAEVAGKLMKRGKELLFYDPSVKFSQLTDSNRDHVLSRIPDLESRLAGSFDELYNWSDVVVIGHRLPEIEYAVSLDTDKVIVDLVRAADDIGDACGNYIGIGW